MSPSTLERLRIPLGSLVVDASLVVAIIWWGATMTERLETMSRDITAIQHNGTTGALNHIASLDQRLAVAETQQKNADRRLERIEEKIDTLLARHP